MNSPMLGLDIGLRRTGVALSESGLIAEPLKTIEWHLPHAHTLITEIIELIRQYQVRTVVVGIPYGEHDEVTSQAFKTTGIIQQLEAAIKRENLTAQVVHNNEYNSSQDADALFPGVERDAAAAALILQDYLEQIGESW
jgi:putative Holliday junction resolvase